MWMTEFAQPGQAPGSRPAERRAAASLSSQWLGLVLEELDHGVVLLNGAGRVLHANLAARASLDDNHPLEMVGPHLRARLRYRWPRRWKAPRRAAGAACCAWVTSAPSAAVPTSSSCR
jgi:hypothetical protein